ncbi:MAG: glycosyltransferase, partial [Candidatus Binatia bacterium]
RDLELSAILFNEGRLLDELRCLGVQTHVIPESQHHSLSLLKQLADYFRFNEVDIVHTHKYKDNVLGGLASFMRNVPFRIRTIHGLPELYDGLRAFKYGVYHMVDTRVNRWLVDHILTVSFELRNQLINYFGSEKVTCVHNAISVSKMRTNRSLVELRKELKIGELEFLIGTVCRLTPVKGLAVLLKAAQTICSQRPGVKFIIVGDGPSRDFLHGLASGYDLGNDVLFLGHRSDAHAILELMDIFVLPSLSEGIPVALLEALALARPVVATRVGGIPEVVEHGASGLLVTPGKEDELAQSCIDLMDNYAWAKSLGASGRKRVTKHFSPAVMADQVAKVYRALVFSGKPRARRRSISLVSHACPPLLCPGGEKPREYQSLPRPDSVEIGQ